MTDAELRVEVFALANGMCEWPGHDTVPATELAHLHSKGIGGRPSANALLNGMAACADHARITDGLYAGGGKRQYVEAHAELGIVIGKSVMADAGIGWARSEKLREHLEESRNWAA